MRAENRWVRIIFQVVGAIFIVMGFAMSCQHEYDAGSQFKRKLKPLQNEVVGGVSPGVPPKPVVVPIERFSAAHILIAHNESTPAVKGVVRNREAAEKRAVKIQQQFKEGMTFSALASTFSDGKSGKKRGGDLGTFMGNERPVPFVEAVKGLQVGEISEIVESPEGFHIIKRQAVNREWLAASVINLYLSPPPVAPKGQPPLRRNRAQLAKLITEVHQRLVNGEDFAQVARETTEDLVGRQTGGYTGVFRAYAMDPQLVEKVRGMEVGAFSTPLAFEEGFRIVKREEVSHIHVRHILIMHSDYGKKYFGVTRSKEEARALAVSVRAKIVGGEDFGQVAVLNSNCPSGKTRGGDLGTVGKGRMALEFEEAVYALKEKEISGPVETKFGFHIIERLPL